MKAQTIYDYLREYAARENLTIYTDEQIDEVIAILKQNEKMKGPFERRYGLDLHVIARSKLDQNEFNYFYGTVIPWIKRELYKKYDKPKVYKGPKSQNQDDTPKVRKGRPPKTIKTENTNPVQSQLVGEKRAIFSVEPKEQEITDVIPVPVKQTESQEVSREEPAAIPVPVKQTVAQEVSRDVPVATPVPVKQEAVKEVPSGIPAVVSEKPLVEKSNVQQESILKQLEFVRSIPFGEIAASVSPDEAILAGLKLGYYKGKYFNNETISKITGATDEEINDAVKKSLTIYRDHLLNSLNNIDAALETVGMKKSLTIEEKD